MKQEIPWNRFAVEAFVIVSSILLAFSIDAWWDNRKELAEEKIALFDLRNELNENLAAIEDVWLSRHTNSFFRSVILLREVYGLPLDTSSIDETLVKFSSGEDWALSLSDFYTNEVLIAIANTNFSASPVSVTVNDIIGIRNASTYGPSVASLDVLFQSGIVNTIKNSELPARQLFGA